MDTFACGVSSGPVVPGTASLLANKEVFRVVDIAERAVLDRIEDLNSKARIRTVLKKGPQPISRPAIY